MESNFAPPIATFCGLCNRLAFFNRICSMESWGDHEFIAQEKIEFRKAYLQLDFSESVENRFRGTKSKNILRSLMGNFVIHLQSTLPLRASARSL